MRPLALALVAPLLAAVVAPQEVTDDLARAAFERLDAAARKEVVDWFSAEVKYAGTFQGQLVEHLVGSVEEDPGLAPPPAPITWFDPLEHAPAQPIPRRPLAANSSAAEKARKRFLRVPSSHECERAWSWDWGTGTLRRGANVDEVERIFRNALRGFVPDHDLAHALLLGKLDDGAERKTLLAFAHAYTDRTGTVFPDVTLYDAWSSGATMEMPDVDILGVLHDVANIKKYKAPIPNSKQDAAYEQVGELFVRARKHRTLRETLADVYLDGEPFDRNGFGGYLLNIHALWDSKNSDPDELVDELPGVDERDAWLKRLAGDCEKTEMLDRSLIRRNALAADRSRVRATLIRVLREFGALGDK